MPDEDIDWWLRLARPCLRLVKDGSGPVAGHFGGRPELPASVAWPAGTVHLASIDLAAIPRDAIDLDLPGDGTLVFFSEPDMVATVGVVVHVPAGAAVVEAEPPTGARTGYDRFPLHLVPEWSFPEGPSGSLAYRGESRADENAYREIVWELGYDEGGHDVVVLLGGYGTSNTGGLGVPVGPAETEVLLAEFYLTEEKVGNDFETDFATLFYVITRDDLAAGRFDRVLLAADFHG